MADWDVSGVSDMSELLYGFSIFNEDLSNWNTSSVTTMGYMFYVRTSPCCSQSTVEPSLHAACTAVARHLPVGTLPLIACPSFDSRQSAKAFNQPLSFDTSSVTDMAYMFRVRSSPCPALNLQSSPPLHAACTAVARHLRPPGLHLAPHRTPPFRLSAVRVGVQPAAELRHLQRHRHGLHVPGALLPVPCSQSAAKSTPTRCVHR
eukprot:scaffold21831_cov48-Phaeocystis_antarctica.AAC.1